MFIPAGVYTCGPDFLWRLEEQPGLSVGPPNEDSKDVCFSYITGQVVTLPKRTNVMTTREKLKDLEVEETEGQESAQEEAGSAQEKGKSAQAKEEEPQKKKKKIRQVNREVVLPDIARMIHTEEAVQDVVTVLGVKVSEFQEAQENMSKIGNRYHLVEPW